MCIEDNACFYSGGGHTLVGPNYAHVTCSVSHVTCSVYGKKFRFAALLGIVLDL